MSEDLPELERDELRRYGRHLVLPQVGLEGQRRLKAARVLLVGAGGLGSPTALYLAAAGVGTLGLIDDDRVERSNLQRQILYGEATVGRPKVEAAAERLRDLNPQVRLELHPNRLDADNVVDLVERYDLVVDGSDNFQTRYLVNDACVLAGKPDVWGAVAQFEGQVAVFGVPGGPCYRCLFPEPPPPELVPNCAEGGVLGVLPGIVGGLQANETIRWILDVGSSLAGRLVIFDALRTRFRELTLEPDPDCPMCGRAPGERRLIPVAAGADCSLAAFRPDPEETPVTDAASNDTTSGAPAAPVEITVADLAAWREEGKRHKVLDVRRPVEFQVCSLPDADLIPLHELTGRLDEIDRDALTVVYCHHGSRSMQAVRFLRQQGFSQVTNLRGGIDAWSLEIDPGVPRY